VAVRKSIGEGSVMGVELKKVGIKNEDEDGESLTHNFRVVDVSHYGDSHCHSEGLRYYKIKCLSEIKITI